jgi:hypothetical protein
MKRHAVTNDDLAAFLERMKLRESYRNLADIEILQLERDKANFFLSSYVGLSLFVALFTGTHQLAIYSFPFLIVLFFGALFFMKRERRLDDFIVFLISRHDSSKS